MQQSIADGGKPNLPGGFLGVTDTPWVIWGIVEMVLRGVRDNLG